MPRATEQSNGSETALAGKVTKFEKTDGSEDERDSLPATQC